MAANTAPIFTLTPGLGVVDITAALTKTSGTGTIATDIWKAYTVGANGSWISKAQFSTVGTTANTASTATIGRVYTSTQSSGATTGGTNTWLLGEVNLASQTADSSTGPTFANVLPINAAFPSGQYILGSTHHAPAANTGQQLLVLCGDY